MSSVFISSWNGQPAIAHAASRVAAGHPLLDSIVDGVAIVEDDPEEMSVGYGGLPNEACEVELDACVMDGAAHRSGAVAGIRRIRNAARVALEVMRRTDHCLLVGDGAHAFARLVGFKDEDLLTERSRRAWLDWKASLSERDAWIAPGEQTSDFGTARWAGKRSSTGLPPTVPFTFGTIHVSGTDGAGNLSAATSTSGLSYKIPGRVGDSACVGAGIYCENGVGSAGATGRGEAALQTCAALRIVDSMRTGKSPTEACLETLRLIASLTRDRRLLDSGGMPTFNVTLYALRADGAFGAASMQPGYEFAVHDQRGTRLEPAASLITPTPT